MKVLLLGLLASAALTLAACQSDMTGLPRTPEATPAATAGNQADVPHGDAYFEEMIGRYDLSNAK